MRLCTFFLLVILLISSALHGADTYQLSGDWGFRLDPKSIGIERHWYTHDLSDRIKLPGTTDQSALGYQLRKDSMDYGVSVVESDWPGHPTPQRVDEAGHLLREWFYIGKAWYQRDINIPASWAGIRSRVSRGEKYGAR